MLAPASSSRLTTLAQGETLISISVRTGAGLGVCTATSFGAAATSCRRYDTAPTARAAVTTMRPAAYQRTLPEDLDGAGRCTFNAAAHSSFNRRHSVLRSLSANGSASSAAFKALSALF